MTIFNFSIFIILNILNFLLKFNKHEFFYGVMKTQET